MGFEKTGWDSHFQNIFDNRKKDKWLAARVISSAQGIWTLKTADGDIYSKVSGRFRHKSGAKKERPVTGDWVFYSKDKNSEIAIIHEILDRKSSISRNAAGGRARFSGGAVKEQVIAANIDIVFIVSGLDRDYNPRRIERYLTMIYNSGASPVVILNKKDIHPDPDNAVSEIEEISVGAPVHAISAIEKNETKNLLEQYLNPGTTTALLGSSGVGKSTLINTLLGEEVQRTSEVSEMVGKGVHTTTHRELLFLENGSVLMDNPGMRELQIWDEDAASDGAFEDIDELAMTCRFSDCSHTSEPGCAIIEAIKNESLEKERFEGYLKLKAETELLAKRKTKTASTLEREKWKDIRKFQKKIYKNKK